ncbi:hypothetical protein GG681_02930 [Epibacterium sp. SM1969]|uniref:Hemolysin, chromosomal n=1 Tax=Tritonibacter aquimaris TaxID=2663379 RepID=A0A844AU92_9RHOB|nr:calcium-binding protein [Tritonibacter aquimaris]MQY41581.1 hypothetical protein [Tritonibacter aquimaris]
MIGVALLATLLVGGVVLSIDDDDDDNRNETSFDEGEEERFLPEVPEGTSERATEGDDSLFVDAQDVEINGGAGSDTVFGSAGEDTLSGGDNVDILFGMEGDDTLEGGAENDALFGNQGDDTLFGGSGTDVAFGGSGDDLINGGSFSDVLFGGHGEDTLNGDQGDDLIVAVEHGDDLREVEEFIDHGEPLTGLELEAASDGADVINGGDGNDFTIFGAGDTVTGGDGNDTFALFTDPSPSGPAYITDYEPREDTISILVDVDDVEEIEESNARITVVNDTDTGDALIMQDGVTLARVEDAGDTLTVDDLQLLFYDADAIS